MSKYRNKFKPQREVHEVKEVSDKKHILSVTVPVYIFYVDPKSNHTICDSKQNIDFDFAFIHSDADLNQRKIVRKYMNLNHDRRFILDDQSMHLSYYKQRDEVDIEDTAKDPIIEYLKKEFNIPKSFDKNNIVFNNITLKQIKKDVYMLPSIVEAHIIDTNHRRYKIESALSD